VRRAVGPSLGLLAAALVAGCGAHPLATPIDGSPPENDAEPDAAATSEGDAAGPCASPAPCNDDPAMSGLAGTCHVFDGPPQSWWCECADGFSINPATGRCRAGTACVAAAADAWPFKMPFDTTDCGSRAPTACESSDAGAEMRVEGTVGSLGWQPTCSLPELLTVRIEITDGCPTLLEGRGVGRSLSPQDTAFLACYGARLASTHVACGSGMACQMMEWDLLP
jgi:hypothetical protein